MIIDEIHAMVDDKRGSHLSLSLARLDDLVTKAGGSRLQRIGLSATVRPIEEVAKFVSPDKQFRSSTAGTAASWISPLKSRRMNWAQ